MKMRLNYPVRLINSSEGKSLIIHGFDPTPRLTLAENEAFQGQALVELSLSTLEKMILDKLDEVEAKDEDIVLPQSIEFYLNNTEKNELFSPNDFMTLICVDFISKKRGYYCQRFLPPIMKTTLILEMLLYIPLVAWAIANTEKQKFSLDDDVVKGLGTAQGFCFSAYMILSMVLGRGGSNMGNFGAAFDEFYYAIKRTFTCRKSNKSQENYPYSQYAKAWLAKFAASLFYVVYFLSDLFLNFSQLQGLTQMVGQMSALSIFSPTVIYHTATINFWLNQINDPIYGASLLNYTFKAINKKFYTPKALLKRENDRIPQLELTDGNSNSVIIEIEPPAFPSTVLSVQQPAAFTTSTTPLSNEEWMSSMAESFLSSPTEKIRSFSEDWMSFYVPPVANARVTDQNMQDQPAASTTKHNI